MESEPLAEFRMNSEASSGLLRRFVFRTEARAKRQWLVTKREVGWGVKIGISPKPVISSRFHLADIPENSLGK